VDLDAGVELLRPVTLYRLEAICRDLRRRLDDLIRIKDQSGKAVETQDVRRDLRDRASFEIESFECRQKAPKTTTGP
jgi:hypothetical protein